MAKRALRSGKENLQKFQEDPTPNPQSNDIGEKAKAKDKEKAKEKERVFPKPIPIPNLWSPRNLRPQSNASGVVGRVIMTQSVGTNIRNKDPKISNPSQSHKMPQVLLQC